MNRVALVSIAGAFALVSAAADMNRVALVSIAGAFALVSAAADGKITTGRVAVSKDGVKPPQ